MSSAVSKIPATPESRGSLREQDVLFTAGGTSDTITGLSFSRVLGVFGNLPGATPDPTYDAATGVLTFASGLTNGHRYRITIKGY